MTEVTHLVISHVLVVCVDVDPAVVVAVIVVGLVLVAEGLAVDEAAVIAVTVLGAVRQASFTEGFIPEERSRLTVPKNLFWPFSLCSVIEEVLHVVAQGLDKEVEQER